MKNILVTGGSSFIGKNLVESFKGKYTLAYPTSKELDLLDPDAVDGFFKNKSFDVLIHAALYISNKDKKEFAPDFLGKNLLMLVNLLKHRKKWKKFIFFGSGAEYDKSKPLVKVKEGNIGVSVPRDDYGFFKFIAAKILECYGNTVNLRLFGVYGMHEDYTRRPVSEFIVQSLKRQPVIIRQNRCMDYLYVDDLVRIVEWFVNNQPKYKAYNVGRGKKISLLDIARKVIRITASPKEIQVINLTMGDEYTCDNGRLHAELGNFHFTDFDLSLRELIKWYRNK